MRFVTLWAGALGFGGVGASDLVPAVDDRRGQPGDDSSLVAGDGGGIALAVSMRRGYRA